MSGERGLETGGLWQDTNMARGSGDKVNHNKMERGYILQGIKNSRILNALIRSTRLQKAEVTVFCRLVAQIWQPTEHLVYSARIFRILGPILTMQVQ